MWYTSHKQGFASSMSISKKISSSAQSFLHLNPFLSYSPFLLLLSCLVWNLFFFWFFVARHRLLTSKFNKNIRNTLHRICFALNAIRKSQMLDEAVAKCIQHENLVRWNRKYWTKSLIKTKLYPTSSNTIFDFFFFFLYTFVSSQMHLTFFPASKIYNFWWNFRCIRVGLYIRQDNVSSYSWKGLNKTFCSNLTR